MQTAGFVLFIILLMLAGESAWEHAAHCAAWVLWGVAGVLTILGIRTAQFDPKALFED